jgi:hypothetical protein
MLLSLFVLAVSGCLEGQAPTFSPSPNKPIPLVAGTGYTVVTRDGNDPDSCTAKGYLSIEFGGIRPQGLEGQIVEFLLTDPQGRKLGLDPDSGKEFHEIPRATFEWQSPDEDKDGNGAPEIPNGHFEICGPEPGSYHFAGKALDTGTYYFDVTADSAERPAKYNHSESSDFRLRMKKQISSGSAPALELKYSREFGSTPEITEPSQSSSTSSVPSSPASE